MISSLRGTVLGASGTTAVIDVGGVGFAVETTPEVLRSLRVGEEAMLHTALIVREDALSLFGFATPLELEVFRLLLGIGGVGPRSALGVLAQLDPHRIAGAVREEDHLPFTKVPGIGPKTAKLIVVQLAGKLDGVPAAPGSAGPASADRSALVDALAGMGWPARQAQRVVDDIEEAEPGLPDADLLRRALIALGPSAAKP